MATDDTLFECGPYAVLEGIGSGTMGRVWRARDREYGRLVAMKFLEVELDRQLRSQFRKEVRAQARLRHRGIVQIYDYGELSDALSTVPTTELPAGTPYLVMELAHFGAVPTGRPLGNWRQLRRLLYQLLDALAHAHSRGIVHRDLKPSNIMRMAAREDDGEFVYKLADFGLAHAMAAAPTEQSGFRERPRAGTPAYMAPEQFEGNWHEIGPWTDLYQLGIAAYEWWCGSLPFTDDGVHALARAHCDRRPPPPSPTFSAPPKFEHWINRTIAKSREDRFVQAADAAHALLQIDDFGEDAASDITDPVDAAASNDSLTSTLVRDVQDGFEGGGDTQPMATVSDGDENRERLQLETFPPAPSFEALVPEETLGVRPVGTGRGLVAVARPAYVGRRAERARLWRELEETVLSGELRVTLVRGAERTGKSRLAHWLLTRSYEMGTARVQQAKHPPMRNRLFGLPGMIARSMALMNIDEASMTERIETALRAGRSDEPAGDAGALAERLARETWSRIGRRGEGEDEAPGRPIRDRWLSMVTDCLVWYARERPLVVVLDDLHRADGAVDWLRSVLASRPEAPIHVVATVEPGADDRVDEVVGVVEHRPDVTSIELNAPDESLVRRALQTLLPADDTLADRLVAAADGDLVRLRTLLAQLVEQRTLDRIPDGFALEPGAPSMVAVREELWGRRYGMVLSALSDDERELGARAVERAAAFGTWIDRREWERALSGADRSLVERLRASLFETGAAELVPGGWRFRERRLRNRIAAEAKRAGRWKEHQRRCAETIEALYGEENPDAALRAADHWRRGGRVDRAAERVALAVERARARGDTGGARSLIWWREMVLGGKGD